MTFHRLNVIRMYNFGMGSVDVADQLHMQYIPDHWMLNRKWLWPIYIWWIGGDATKSHLIHRGKIHQAKRKNMYRVPNKMSQLQFLKNMSTNFMTIKKKKSQQLRNKSTAAAASGIKISNYMLLPSFDSRISHQRRAENLDV